MALQYPAYSPRDSGPAHLARRVDSLGLLHRDWRLRGGAGWLEVEGGADMWGPHVNEWRKREAAVVL